MISSYSTTNRRNAVAASSATASSSDEDQNLMELTESALTISETHEVTRIHCSNNNNNTIVDPKNITTLALPSFHTPWNNSSSSNSSSNNHLYANGLYNAGAGETTDSKDALAATSAASTSTASSGLLLDDAWNCGDWESSKRRESQENYMKRHHQKQLRKLTRLRRKTMNDHNRTKVASLVQHYRRKRLLRDTGKHSGNTVTTTDVSWKRISGGSKPSIVKSSHSKPRKRSSQRKQPTKRRVVRFDLDDIDNAENTGWKDIPFSRGRGHGILKNNTSKLGMEFRMEEKKAQRALLDLQVGMKHMGL